MLILQVCNDTFECDDVQHLLNIIRLVRNDYEGGAVFKLNGRPLEVSTSAQKTFGNIRKILSESPIKATIERMKLSGLQYDIVKS